jgi:hypothetical protein
MRQNNLDHHLKTPGTRNQAATTPRSISARAENRSATRSLFLLGICMAFMQDIYFPSPCSSCSRNIQHLREPTYAIAIPSSFSLVIYDIASLYSRTGYLRRESHQQICRGRMGYPLHGDVCVTNREPLPRGEVQKVLQGNVMLHYQFSVTFDVYGHGYHKTLNVHTCMHTTVTLLLIHSNNHKRSTLKTFSKVDTFSIAGCGKASGNECLITGWLAEGEKNRTKDCGCGLFGS